jgi:hypothetical protein
MDGEEHPTENQKVEPNQTSSLINKFEKLQKEKLKTGSPRNSPNTSNSNDEELFKKKQSLEAFFQKQGNPQKPKINPSIEERSSLTSPSVSVSGELSKKFSSFGGSKTPEFTSPRLMVSETSEDSNFSIKRETVESMLSKWLDQTSSSSLTETNDSTVKLEEESDLGSDNEEELTSGKVSVPSIELNQLNSNEKKKKLSIFSRLISPRIVSPKGSDSSLTPSPRAELKDSPRLENPQEAEIDSQPVSNEFRKKLNKRTFTIFKKKEPFRPTISMERKVSIDTKSNLTQTKETSRKGTVLFNFEKQEEYEISVSEGDVIEIIRDDPDGWSEIKFHENQGFIPSEYYKEVTVINKHHSYRGNVISEFIMTEINYVENMKRLSVYYIEPCEKFFSKQKLSEIFSNANVVLGVNSLFLQKLEIIISSDNIDKQQTELADLLLEYSQLFKLYVAYISNYENSTKLLQDEAKKNKKFKEFLNKTTKLLSDQGCRITDMFS